MTDARERLKALFKARRFDPAHHLGLGDIRLTIADQEAILDAMPKGPGLPWVNGAGRLPTEQDANATNQVLSIANGEVFSAHYTNISGVEPLRWWLSFSALPLPDGESE